MSHRLGVKDEPAPLQAGWMRELAELRGQSVESLGLALACLGYAWALAQIMAMHPDFRWLPLATPLSAGVLGMLVLVLRRPLVLRSVLLLTGLLGLASMAMFVQRSGNAPFIYAVLAGVAPLVTVSGSAFAVAALGSITLLAAEYLLPGVWPWATLSGAIALTWMAALIAYLSSRNLYTVLVWALRGHEVSSRTTHELQEERGRANRTMRALADANLLLKRTTYDLSEARQEAERGRQLKSQFAANISHELRTPLHLIVGFSQMMYNSPETYKQVRWSGELRADIRAIYESAQHLLGLIDDVLDLSRIEVARMPIAKEQVSLAPIIREAVETGRSLLRNRSLILEVKLPEALPALYADPTRVRQVLLNLLNNAARFTEEGRITVRALAREDDVEVIVEDTGIGIPPDQMGDLFSEFHQVDASIRRKHDGTGLGLALCKHFITLHDGRVWAESELGKGSAFHFTLPLPSKQAVPIQVSRLPRDWRYPAAKPRAPRRVVVLAPSPEPAQMLRRYLTEVDVIEASDSAQASALAREHQADAVICAADAGTQDAGDAVAEATRELMLPVMTVSLPLERNLALAEGFTHCLMKPFTTEALLRVLDSAAPGARSVLVVDDDEGVVRLVRRGLAAARPQMTILSAYDGRQAIALLDRQPDAVLLDLILPHASGLDVLAEAKRRSQLAGVPLIAITAYGFEQDLALIGGGALTVRRGRGFGADEITQWLGAVLDLLPARYLAPGPPDPAPAPIPAG